MNAGLTILADGMTGEIGRLDRPNRPNGKTMAAKGIPSDTLPYDPKLKKLAEEFGCDPEDFARLSPTGLLGNVSPAAAKRIGRMAQRLGESCAWTRVDCVAILRGACRTGEGDKSEVPHEKIAAWLGISVERSQKDLRLFNAFPREARQSILSVTIHEEVASLDGEDRTQVLTVAAEKKLSCVDVRELVRDIRAKTPPDPTKKRRGRQPRLPVAPSDVAPRSQGLLAPPVSVDIKPSPVVSARPSDGGPIVYTPAPLPLPANVPVDATPAPVGIAHFQPSLVPGKDAPRFVLQDEDARRLLWADCGHDVKLAESKLAEIVRAYYAKKTAAADSFCCCFLRVFDGVLFVPQICGLVYTADLRCSVSS